VEYFAQGSKNKKVTVLRFQVISDKFTAYRMCNHSVTHPNNAGRKQQQQQQQKKKSILIQRIPSHIGHNPMAIEAYTQYQHVKS